MQTRGALCDLTAFSRIFSLSLGLSPIYTLHYRFDPSIRSAVTENISSNNNDISSSANTKIQFSLTKMASLLRFLFVFVIVLVLVEAQYRMMANYGPAWRQRMWRKTRIPAYPEPSDSGMMDLLAN